jgi:hypothetical protein
MLLLLLITITVPPAAKTLVVIGVVYAIVQGLKKAPWFSTYLKGWWAVGVNYIFTATGLLIFIPENQLYTVNTLMMLVTTGLGAAGIHGTVATLTTPEMAVTFPPNPEVLEAKAHLTPNNPAAVPVDPKKS